MRWIAASAVLLLAGCGGLERHSYPAAEHEILMIGQVAHVQPFEGEASESGWSRAGWGTLAGGVIVGAAAGLSDSDIGTFDAYSYVIRPSQGEPQVVNSYTKVEKGECVAIYRAVKNSMHSLSKLAQERCQP